MRTYTPEGFLARLTAYSSPAMVWWQRCWIVQEVAVSTSIVVHCGTRSLDWKDLIYFGNIVTIVWRSQGWDKPVLVAVLPSFLESRKVKSRLDEISQTTQTHLLSSSASDPRDKVYAILGLTGRFQEE